MNISIDKLKGLRKQNGWSQERLADISGVSLRTIQRIESGENASFESQLSIATAFNIPPSELLDDKEVKVGNGGVNWGGITGILLCLALMLLQFKLGSAPYFDLVSLLLVIGLPFAMSSLSLGLRNSISTLSLIRWVFVLPKNEIALQKFLPPLNKYIIYCHVAGGISTLVGIIAVFMTSASYEYQYAPVAKYPFAMGLGVSMLTSLYAAMFAEFILRPLKHMIERQLIHHKNQ
ncbi:helix-turn-helix domain-containing protein [Thalassotalea hakodatensis]|uniref:helix-turn-helix domain-containing protein n=1 Tax=Thalassotalea hakodatensis TaxID=3030492 RepID=UPI002573289E|nr:helix-turn-helix transcriptional regulator [Thalassotalea hakodatensis]